MKFLRRRRETKLYKQWVQHDGLPLEVVPRREAAEDTEVRREERDRLRPYKEKLVDMIRRLLKV